MPEQAKIKKITQKYATISKLIAANRTKTIGICTDGKYYYIHSREKIYDYVNPMSPYKEAHFVNDILCIML